MKKLKVILPMLAFVFAIGMSFAFVNTTAEDYYVSGYIVIDGTPYNVEVNCNLQTQENCLAELDTEPGVEYEVIDPATDLPFKDGTGEAYIISDPRQ